MGSQTLEILRQGVWASLTGGWFYDPHQDVFCNTFHLYIWLFLLCLPFTIYLYFPPTDGVWMGYCCVMLVVFLVLKLANLWLHHMYDTSECITEPMDQVEMTKIRRATHINPGQRKTRRGSESAGIEMSILKDIPPVQCSSRNSLQDSPGSSQTSREDLKLSGGVIDLKADVHRKNSSESSEELAGLRPIVEQPAVHRAESYTQRDHERFRQRLLENRHKQLRQRDVDNGCGAGKLKRRLSGHAANADIAFPSGLPGAGAPPVKPTSSLELAHLQVPPGYMHWKQQGGWCQRRSGAEGTGSRNELSLTNHVAPYYCSEIVYPIAETSDEVQPLETDMHSCAGSGDEGSSRSPLLVRRESAVSSTSALALSMGDIPLPSTTALTEPLPPPPPPPPEPDEVEREGDVDADAEGEGRDSSPLGLDWLFEHTDSECSGIEPPLWNYTRSDDSDFVAETTSIAEDNSCAKGAESWGSSATLSLEHEVTKLLPPTATVHPLSTPGAGAAGQTVEGGRSQGAIPKRRAPPDESHGAAAVGQQRGPPERRRRRFGNGVVDRREVETSAIYVTMKPVSATSLGPETETVEPDREAASSSGSNTELSSLLPAPPAANSTPLGGRPRDADRSSRSRHRRLKRSGRAHRLPSTPATHLAANHDDTTQGAVHCFRDQQGNWLSYTFDDKGSGSVNGLAAVNNGKLLSTLLSHGQPVDWPSMSRDDDCKLSDDGWLFSGGKITCPAPNELAGNALSPLAGRLLNDSLGERHNVHANASAILLCGAESSAVPGGVGAGELESGRPRFRFLDPEVTPETPGNSGGARPRTYHLLVAAPCLKVKVSLDRLALLALLDRNPSVREALLGVTLALAVAALGAAMLRAGFFRDAAAFFFCFVMAGCQYSLLKSVQPDASSPTHGFNRLAAFSRPVYFCIVASAALATQSPVCDWLAGFLLAFPLVFSLGLLPQVNTFATYLLEQIETHVFGGGAVAGLGAGLFCVVRSSLAVMATLGFAYGAMLEPRRQQHFLYSAFCGLTVAIGYHLSRSASDPTALWQIAKGQLLDAGADSKGEDAEDKDGGDPLPAKLRETVNARIKSDALVCTGFALVVGGVHASTVWTALQPEAVPVLCSVASLLGLALHYVAPQLRKQLPWLCLARPVLRQHEHGQYEVHAAAKVMWFERCYLWLGVVQRNLVYPCLFVAALTADASPLTVSVGPLWAAVLLSVCGMKAVRQGFSDPAGAAMSAAVAALLFTCDFPGLGNGFVVDNAIAAVMVSKVRELLLKVQFVVTYIAPWQITWGSAFHAFAQPFSVPHSAMLFAQAVLSAVLSAPLNPFLGSAVFLASYVRPVRFWEREYNTRRVDHSNTRLSAQLERNMGADDNNLNSIFYEHLTRSLQHSLCGDLMMGRWGPVAQGDVFVLASDYLNCLVHVVELANGLVSFQVRGLEFRGTYCQQREVEAISEWAEENDGCCCCEPGHPPHVLSVNAAFSQRWLAWEVTATKYVLEGYSISDNSAVSMLQVYDFRKVLVSYYVKSMIFYAVGSPRLEAWLASPAILAALAPTQDKNFVELDPVFNMNVDQDFDFRAAGVTRSSFCNVYLEWISFCSARAGKGAADRDGALVSLCLALSLLGRRALGTASHSVGSVEAFLHGMHALFKGDFRITSPRDEWVFSAVELLGQVVAPGVRMSLKLHQEHFASPDEYAEPGALHDAIRRHADTLVIAHEADPAWRKAVLAGTPSLLSLRHVVDDGADEYKVVMLNKRHLGFRVIKANRECVRGLWAGQQQELVYLRNRNPERGSIQNAKQALRNIINSSCDQPIGYPIYVSPLTTSYAETNTQLCSVVGGALSLTGLRDSAAALWQRWRRRCAQGCSSGGGGGRADEGAGVYAMATLGPPPWSGSQSLDSRQRQSFAASVAGKPGSATLASLAGLLGNDKAPVATATNEGDAEPTRIVRIVDPTAVYDAINLGRRIDVAWPDERMRARGGRSHWRDWLPEKGMTGPVVHRWAPSHRDPARRSHVDRAILLVKIDDKYVPIAESAVQDVVPET